jgi:O-antigen/teichoic acid export membrane protein
LVRVAGTYCYVLLPVAVALAATAVTVFVPEFLGVAGFVWGIELFAIGLLPASFVFALSVAQAREDLTRFVWVSSTSVLVTAASKLVLVVALQMGVLGWVISDLVSASLAAVVAISLVRLPRARVARTDIRSALRFAVPLIPHGASLWALTSLSRPAMAAVSTLDQVGLLAFGLSLASVANLVIAEINRAVLVRYSRETLPAPTGETLALVRWQLIVAFVIPAVVGSGVAVAGRWIFAEAYWPSFALTGTLLIGQAAYGLYLIPMNYLTQTAGLPKYSALASGAGAAVIFASILILGQRYGAVGVAYGTAAGYVTMAAVALSLTKALKIDVVWSRWLVHWPEVLLGAAALTCSVVALAAPAGSTIGWALTGACGLLVVGTLVVGARRKGRQLAEGI